MSGSRIFPATAVSVGAARRFVESELGTTPPAIVEAVALAVSELATNSVRHAATPFTVVVERTTDCVRVEVSDHGSGVPALRSPGPSELSGRGLLLVRELSDEWGVRAAADGPGNSVWFTIDTPDQRFLQAR